MHSFWRAAVTSISRRPGKSVHPTIVDTTTGTETGTVFVTGLLMTAQQ